MTITQSEWRWAIWWSGVALACTCFPFLIAYLLTPPGWQFAGLLDNIRDSHTYLAKMRLGYEGQWLFYLTYTPEPHAGVFIYPVYLALGHVARLTNLPLIAVFHAARLLAGAGMLLSLFRFISLITPKPAERRLAFLLLISSSGLGWLILPLFQIQTTDLWNDEAFIPHTLYDNPHFPLATMLMLLILSEIIKAESPYDSFRLAGFTLALTLTQPMAMIATGAILVAFGLWQWLYLQTLTARYCRLTILIGLTALPIIFYNDWALTHNPIMAGWRSQNLSLTPPLPLIIGGYGLLLGWAALGLVLVVRHSSPSQGEWLCVIWLITILGLIYVPVPWQRRLIHGLHVPIGLLAAMALHRLSLQRLTVITMCMGFGGTLFFLFMPIIAIWQRDTPHEFFYLRQEEVAVFAWINHHISTDTVILASPRTGMFIPSQTHVRTFFGHVSETVQAAERFRLSEAFFRGDIKTIPPEVDLIFYGENERAFGHPNILNTLPILFQTETVQLYQVVP